MAVHYPDMKGKNAKKKKMQKKKKKKKNPKKKKKKKKELQVKCTSKNISAILTSQK